MEKKTLILVVLFLLSWGCGQNPENLLHTAQDHFQKREYDQAIEGYKKYLALEPQAAGAYNMLGMAYRFKYNETGIMDLRDKEILSFQKAIELDPKFWVAMINLGTTYYYNGDKAKAAPLFARALLLHPDHPEKVQLEQMIAEGRKK
jgi:tetratricopeptide (TPR) repeat protein